MNKSTFGITIGPIYDVIKSAKKTREIWFGSYFFSWFMKVLYCELKKDKVNIITPYYDGCKASDEQESENNGSKTAGSRAGLFPDQIIGFSELDQTELKKLLNTSIEETETFFVNLIDRMIGTGYSKGKGKSDVEAILKSYIQIDYVIFDKDKIDENNIVGEIQLYLDAIEKNRKFSLGKSEPTCARCKTLPAVAKITDPHATFDYQQEQTVCPLCFIKFAALLDGKIRAMVGFDKDDKYPSTGEISARELIDVLIREKPDEWNNFKKNIDKRKKNIDKQKKSKDEFDFDDPELITLIKSVGKEFKPYHKYMAIVYADGDNMADAAKELFKDKTKSPDELSKRLFEFSIKAEQLIKRYKGEPVYLGGDDIVAFLPTAFKEDTEIKTILDFVNEINTEYNMILKDFESPVTTISIGINLFYYKSPLSLAMSEAAGQLFYIAKIVSGKNTLALLLTQHSGHTTPVTLNFNTFEQYRLLTDNILNGKITITDSMHHNLARFKNLLVHLKNYDELCAFFENNFNEPEHTAYSGINVVRDLIHSELSLNGSLSYSLNEKEIREKLEKILNFLKLIQFIKG